jgi:hypothetical protein
MVDRRIRDLCEALAEVRRERPRAARERGDRRVVPHRVHGVAPRLRDRTEHQAQVLARVAVQGMPCDEVVCGRLQPLAGLAEADALRDPGRVGPRGGELAGQLAVEPQPVLRVDREERARAEASPPDADPLGKRDGARLGGDGDEPSSQIDAGGLRPLRSSFARRSRP